MLRRRNEQDRWGNLPHFPETTKMSIHVADVITPRKVEDNDFIPMDPMDGSDLSRDESEIEMESENEDDTFKRLE